MKKNYFLTLLLTLFISGLSLVVIITELAEFLTIQIKPLIYLEFQVRMAQELAMNLRMVELKESLLLVLQVQHGMNLNGMFGLILQYQDVLAIQIHQDLHQLIMIQERGLVQLQGRQYLLDRL